ncbi:MAG: diaminobutyrate--2-oxoglutarate transaminase [Dinoroseobacter sp.]|nr:diaminobutyrate--2-oxoglutarate transaminase [Dinoroseobacter sp.]
MKQISSENIDIFNHRESAVRSYCRGFPEVLEKAQGSYVWSSAGRRYIDFLAGCGSLNYGHNDPDMKAALQQYVAGDGIAHSLDLHTEAKADFLFCFHENVLKPRGLEYRVQFTGPTGANAVEAALKLARKRTGRTNVIAFTNGFHGVTQGALSATGNRYNRLGAATPLSGVTRLPFDGYLGPDVDSADLLERMLEDPSSGVDAPAAFILEIVQGEGGLNVARAEWLRRVADIAKAHGALLIVDEVQTGCGRTGDFFAFEEAGLVPDLVPMAKSISGFGLPLALLLIKPEHDTWKPGEHNGTFRGNAHAFVTAAAAIKKFWADGAFGKTVQSKSEFLKACLEDIASEHPRLRVKGRGMLQGIDVGCGKWASEICAEAAHRGLVMETSGPNDEVVKVLAPLTTPENVLKHGLSILSDAISATLAAPLAAAE